MELAVLEHTERRSDKDNNNITNSRFGLSMPPFGGMGRVMELVNEGDFVLIENNAFNALGAAKSKLAELNGIIKFALWKRGIQHVLVAPTTLKKFILGSGKGKEKSQITKEVLKQFHVDTLTDDEADAVVLAHIGCCLVGLEQPSNKAQREVLVTLTAEKISRRT